LTGFAAASTAGAAVGSGIRVLLEGKDSGWDRKAHAVVGGCGLCGCSEEWVQLYETGQRRQHALPRQHRSGAPLPFSTRAFAGICTVWRLKAGLPPVKRPASSCPAAVLLSARYRGAGCRRSEWSGGSSCCSDTGGDGPSGEYTHTNVSANGAVLCRGTLNRSWIAAFGIKIGEG